MEEKGALSDLARQVVTENKKTFKIVLTPNQRWTETLVKLLTKVHKISPKTIASPGYTATDEQNDSIMRQRKLIVVVTDDIASNRPLRFYPPVDAKEVALIQVFGGTIDVTRRPCTEDPFDIRRK